MKVIEIKKDTYKILCVLLALCSCKPKETSRENSSNEHEDSFLVVDDCNRLGLEIVKVECPIGVIEVHEYCPPDSQSTIVRDFKVFLRDTDRENFDKKVNFLNFQYFGLEQVTVHIERNPDTLVFRVQESEEGSQPEIHGNSKDLIRFPLSSIP